MKSITGFGGFVLFFIVITFLLIGAGPLVTIFTLNGLFGLMIAYNFTNWFCVVWLTIVYVLVNHLSKS